MVVLGRVPGNWLEAVAAELMLTGGGGLSAACLELVPKTDLLGLSVKVCPWSHLLVGDPTLSGVATSGYHCTEVQVNVILKQGCCI